MAWNKIPGEREPKVKAEPMPRMPPIDVRMIDRKVTEAHARGLCHMVRQIDSGLLDAKMQEVHVKIIRMLEHIAGYELPRLYESLGIVERKKDEHDQHRGTVPTDGRRREEAQPPQRDVGQAR